MASGFAPGLFKGQVWLVTGGGTGIGFRIASDAVALGARVALAGRREAPLRESVAALGGSAVATAFVCDIRDDASVEACVRGVLALWGQIDVLINNAGGQFMTRAEDCKPKGFDAVVRNNLLGTWRMTYYVATAAMIPRKQGAIVNIIANVRNGFPGMVHTGAARAGVDNLTKTTAIEWAPHNVRVNAVAPGVIWTASGTEAHYAPETLQRAVESQPIQRFGTAAEVSSVTLLLASAQLSGFTTGQTWYVDGGQSLTARPWAVAKL